MIHSEQKETLPLVSVIIPTYNRYLFLLEAMDSVKNQSYNNMEIIIVDDGSTDNTNTIKSKSNIKINRIKHSGFPGHVRNIGALASSGKYIAFLDSDDLWKQEKLKKQIHFFLNNPEISICHTREIWQRKTKIVSQKSQKHKRSGFIFEDALKKCIIGPSTVMLKRELFFEIGMFDPKIEIAEDYELWLRICAKHKIGYIDEPLVIKQGGHEDQLSWKYKQIEIFRIKALLQNIESSTFTDNNLLLAKKELSRKCHIYSQGCYKRNKKKEGIYYSNLKKKYST